VKQFFTCSIVLNQPYFGCSPKSGAGKAGAGGGRLPDPSLFPFLARRLAAVEGSGPLDDVDAAAAMLELKHGPLRRGE
jgi:hypothetical protein